MMEGFFGSRISGRSKAQLEGQYAVLAEVEAYWEALCDAGDIPQRIDLDPRGIRGALSKSFILDSSNPDHPRFRIVGSDISELQNRSLFGSLFSELFAEPKRDVVATIAKDVARLPAKAQLDLYFNLDGASEIEVRMILLPMRDTAGQCTRILGCLEFGSKGAGGKNATGLDLRGSVVRPLSVQQQTIVRRMDHPALQLVSSREPSELAPTKNQTKPRLSLVTT